MYNDVCIMVNEGVWYFSLFLSVEHTYRLTSNEKIKKNVKGRDREKVKKQDGMSTMIVNYSDK